MHSFFLIKIATNHVALATQKKRSTNFKKFYCDYKYNCITEIKGGFLRNENRKMVVHSITNPTNVDPLYM